MPAIRFEDKVKSEAYNAVADLDLFKQDKNVCSVVAIAFACEVDYEEAYKALETAGRKHGKPAPTEVVIAAAKSFGVKLKAVDKFDIIHDFPAPHDTLKNLTTHHPVRFSDEWPDGKYLAFSRGHVSAIIEGEVHDWAKGHAKRITTLYEVV